jgi:hypothetical protein
MANYALLAQSGNWTGKMRKADQLPRLVAFLLLAYLALTAAGVLAFTFVW